MIPDQTRNALRMIWRSVEHLEAASASFHIAADNLRSAGANVAEVGVVWADGSRVAEAKAAAAASAEKASR